MYKLKEDVKTNVMAFRINKLEKLKIELGAAELNISKGAYIRTKLFNK
jgi:hypothetical protein|tara:strand:- start:389 stop:532 length:144 start_codon:yes stop_codon:yes gene_type:complete